MPEEVTNIEAVKTSSDGTVKLSIEKYNELVQKAAKPSVINRTEVIKTAEMAAKDYRMWGGGFMAVGASLFVIGLSFYRAGLN